MKIADVLRRAKPSIEWTYDKTCDVWGQIPHTKQNGADGVKFGAIESGIQCRLSVTKLDNTQQAQANELHVVHKLFCRPDAPITAGSRLIVNGVKYEATQAPMIYDTHMEVLIHERRWV
ncbi:hypothetical protein NHG32_06915 [Aerococcaceae bacterium NML191219]|nr:hypothetical protein [Aerococcaceae bacterium NML191219]